MDVATLIVIAAHKSGGINELAKRLGVGYNTVYSWKKGINKPKKMAIRCMCDMTDGIVTTDMMGITE